MHAVLRVSPQAQDTSPRCLFGRELRVEGIEGLREGRGEGGERERKRQGRPCGGGGLTLFVCMGAVCMWVLCARVGRQLGKYTSRGCEWQPNPRTLALWIHTGRDPQQVCCLCWCGCVCVCVLCVCVCVYCVSILFVYTHTHARTHARTHTHTHDIYIYIYICMAGNAAELAGVLCAGGRLGAAHVAAATQGQLHG